MTERMHVALWSEKARDRALRRALRPSDGEDKVHLSYVAYMARRGHMKVADCSDCGRFLALQEEPDYGICLNPTSPRQGLLTWEHMGCREWKGG